MREGVEQSLGRTKPHQPWKERPADRKRREEREENWREADRQRRQEEAEEMRRERNGDPDD